MANVSSGFNYEEIIWKKTLNTFKLWVWLHNWEPLNNICPYKISWYIFDTPKWQEEVFSLESRKEAWWEKYKETNIVKTKRLDWTTDDIVLPSIWWGWMWMDISSISLNEAASFKAISGGWYFITSHISSIWTGNFRSPDFFENNWEWFEIYWDIIEKKFYDLFEGELWLTKDQIEKEFLKVNDNLNLDSENFSINTTNQKKDKKTYLDVSFQPVNKAWRLYLMKDLIELYSDIKRAKNKWLFIPVNHMYKSTWYIASIKVAALAWADAITTGAGMPRTWFRESDNIDVNPRDIVIDFYKNIWMENIRMPAFWLIVSMTMAHAPWYDYYIDEDPRNAGWHQWATESMLPYDKRVWKQSVLNSLRKREWVNENTPIYAGWWINSAKDIKEMFDMWFDWIQLWTSFAVSKEARNYQWDDFKKALISWNHFWPEVEIDKIAKKAAENLKENIDKEVEIFRKKFEEILWININNCMITYPDIWWLSSSFNIKTILWLSNTQIIDVINTIEEQIFLNNNEWLSKLNEAQITLYNFISEKLFEKYNWDIKLLRKELRLYWNLLKAYNEFKNFWDLWKIPTHLLFDSVVWFLWRMRINGWEHRLLNGTVMRAIRCVQCVTHCLLTKRWWVSEEQWSRFCINNSLSIWRRDEENDLIVNFTWTTTAFYSEIRPVKDIISAFIWTQIIR
jgi:hypothetical protein